MAKSALDAYRTATRATASGRELEAAALFKAARLLEAVQQNWDAPELDARLQDALAYNARLWTLFLAELSEGEHPLPTDLRVNLLTLSKFVDKRSLEVLGAPRPDGLTALININRQIAMGLSIRVAALVPAAG